MTEMRRTTMCSVLSRVLRNDPSETVVGKLGPKHTAHFPGDAQQGEGCEEPSPQLLQK